MLEVKVTHSLSISINFGKKNFEIPKEYKVVEDSILNQMDGSAIDLL
jgi:hypothetical protein